ADLPRKGVPVEAFYLPIHENWPAPMAGHYNGSYWADEAFSVDYRRRLVQASQAFAEHLNSRRWNDTLFQGFLNNKVDFKLKGWSRGSSPWLLDEPANWQDYWALKWFGEAIHQGWREAGPTGVKLVYRCDVSRPEWQRDALDAVLDYNVVSGGAFYQHHRLVLDRRDRFGQIVVVYGGTNPVEASNTQPVGWCLDSWSLGADGVVPWQSVGNGDSWRQADELSLFYPGESIGRKGPLSSVRLKAYLRGQQDVEYLALLQSSKSLSRRALGDAVRSTLNLRPVRQATGYVGAEDAGLIQFGDLKPQELWMLRRRVAAELVGQSVKQPLAMTAQAFPQRDFAIASPGRVSTEPPLPTVSESPVALKRGPVQTLQGRDVVLDVVIDPKQRDKNLSAVGRDNRLYKNDATNVWLVRFDLAGVKRPTNAQVQRATLSFYVWDPSGSGSTKTAILPLKTAWDESSASWTSPSPKSRWLGANGFELTRDAGGAVASVIVGPDAGDDVADPPIEYQADVTSLTAEWLKGGENFGLAIAPISDRSVDEGASTRFQVHSSRSGRDYGPKLTIEWKP
ncbi:MAG TPA: DNRLRE domain-containing protein, partial [Pirellulales bacterium]